MRPGRVLHDVEVTTLAPPDGYGAADIGGAEIRVPSAAPGDRLNITLDHVSPHKALAWGHISRVLERGPAWREPPCAASLQARGACGGCPGLHVDPEHWRAFKLDATRRALEWLPANVVPSQIETSGSEHGWRNRANYVVERVRGRIRLGSWAPRSHDLAPMPDCLAVRPSIAVVTNQLEGVLNALDVPVGEGPGSLRYVTLRDNGRETLIEYIVRSRAEWQDELASQLAVDRVVGQVVSLNNRPGNAMFGTEPELLLGARTIVETIGAVELEVEASTFLQLNPVVAASIYVRAAGWVADDSVVWDLYCGVGGLGLSAALACGKLELYGAELAPGAVELARANALRNDVADATFVIHDLEASWPDNWRDPNVILVNPPRRGLSALVRQRLNALPASAETLVYMSCSPKSLARDLRALEAGQWVVDEIAVYDMMPSTTHVECLALLRRSKCQTV